MKPAYLLTCFSLIVPLSSLAEQEAQELSVEELEELTIQQLTKDQDRFLALTERLKSSLAAQQVEAFGQELDEVDSAGEEAFWHLADREISQDTVLAQNEAIERILAVAEKASQSSSSSSSSSSSPPNPAGALLQMMRDMAGKPAQIPDPNQQQQDQQEGEGEGEGESSESSSSSSSGAGSSPGGGGGEGQSNQLLEQEEQVDGSQERQVPSTAGRSAIEMPSEYRDQLEEYFRALEDTR